MRRVKKIYNVADKTHMNSVRYLTSSIPFLLVTSVLLSGCSDNKRTPPDDGDGGISAASAVGAAKTSNALSCADFSSCLNEKPDVLGLLSENNQMYLISFCEGASLEAIVHFPEDGQTEALLLNESIRNHCF